jgi:hypothetical protein
MKHSRTLSGAGLAATLACAAVAAVPGIASAQSSCTFDTTTHQVTIIHGAAAGSATTVGAPGGFIQYRDGSGTSFQCTSASGVKASTFNATKIVVHPPSGQGAQFQKTVIDESGGRFAPGSSGPEVKIFVLTGTGGDQLQVIGTKTDDSIQVGQGGGLSIGPVLDLNGDGDVDLSMTDAAFVEVDTGDGNDYVTGEGVSGVMGRSNIALALYGGAGNDALIGGAKADVVLGEQGLDYLGVGGDQTQDYADGGADFDTANADYGDNVKNVEKYVFF